MIWQRVLAGLLTLCVFISVAAWPAEARLQTPPVALFDQHGRTLRYDALVKGRTAVIAFVFAGCSSTCPIVGQRLAQVQKLLGPRLGREIVLVGVSVDPMGDSAAAMARYSAAMGLGPSWRYVNGRPEVMSQLRQTLGGGAGGALHSNFLIVSNDRTGVVSRIDAVTNDSATIARRVLAVAESASNRAQGTARYFGVGSLTTADDRQVEFYRDVLAGQIVLINTIFTRCADACPLITAKIVRAQGLLGRDAAHVRVVSLTNDPAFDTPGKLRQFAHAHGVKGNWTLLTGPDPDVRALLGRLNLGGADPGDHSTALIIGNDRTGSWRRVSPAITPEQLAQLLRQVLMETPR